MKWIALKDKKPRDGQHVLAVTQMIPGFPVWKAHFIDRESQSTRFDRECKCMRCKCMMVNPKRPHPISFQCDDKVERGADVITHWFPIPTFRRKQTLSVIRDMDKSEVRATFGT